MVTLSMWMPAENAATFLNIRVATLRRHIKGLPPEIARRDRSGLWINLGQYVKALRRGLPQRPLPKPRGWTVVIERSRPGRAVLTLIHQETEIRDVIAELAADGELRITPPTVFHARNGWIPVVTLAPAAIAAARAAAGRVLRAQNPEPEAAAAA